jgi:hypothetical protein
MADSYPALRPAASDSPGLAPARGYSQPSRMEKTSWTSDIAWVAVSRSRPQLEAIGRPCTARRATLPLAAGIATFLLRAGRGALGSVASARGLPIRLYQPRACCQPRLRLNEHLAHPGDLVFRHACKMGL